MTQINAATEDELAYELANAPEAPDMADDDGPPATGRRRGEIFDDCPVKPLGVSGDFAYFLDVNGQLRAGKDMKAQFIQSLFGHQIGKLRYNFPIWEKREKNGSTVMERNPKKIDHSYASVVLWEAASECGVFNPGNSVRWVGAWTDDEGRLVYHTGDRILYEGEEYRPGRIGRHIYPARPPIPLPDASANPPDPVPPILDVLESWNWTKPDLHPYVALGMIAVQMMCGALDWRPVFWLLAAAGSGKSEFQNFVKMLHGEDGLIQSTDATKSGITSQLGHSSLPVAVDELEPGDEKSRKETDIITLARVAASGGQWLRGSSDQSGVGGKVYSAFLFSSILIPGVMKTADVQRLIRLELRPLDKSAAKLGLQPRTWHARGARLKALLINRWPTWPERLAEWRLSLEQAGVTGRDADNWGAVLAMADMAQSEEVAPATARANWAEKVAYQVAAGRDDTMNDAEAMLLHMMSWPYDPWRRGEQWTLAQWIMATADLPGAPRALRSSLGGDISDPLPHDLRKKGNEHLARLGLRFYANTNNPDQHQLLIINKQVGGLRQLFAGTDWAGGAWAQSAARVPGAETLANPATLAGIRSRGTLMPLKSIPGLLDLPADKAATAPNAAALDEIEDL